jgi:hypothetical protein
MKRDVSRMRLFPRAAPPEWYKRYASRVENYALPKSDAARQEWARVIAADGERLLAAVDAATDMPGGQAKYVLVAQHVSPEWHRFRGTVCPEGLRAVSAPCTLYEGEAGAADHRVADAGAP